MKYIARFTILFLLLALRCVPSHSQVVELTDIQGQKYRRNYPMLSGSTTYVNLPLPEGEWTVIRGDEYTVGSTEKKMREIFLATVRDVSTGNAVKDLANFLYVNANINGMSFRWFDEPCKGEDFIYMNKYDSGMWNQRCMTIRQSTFLSRSDNKVQQISRNYFEKNNISYVTGQLTINVTIYNRSGKFWEVKFAIFPTLYGLEKPTEGVDSPWHLSKYRNDPEKVLFIEQLKVWAETYSDIINSNFQNDKSSAVNMPEFVFVSANNSKANSAAVKSNSAVPTNSTVVTMPPAAVPATPTTPARVAAIANVDVPVKASVGQVVANQPTQVTTNPIDQVKKTSGNEVWISFNPSITIQQRQFCRIVENFRTENALAQQSKNQIKVNETYRNLTQSLNSLLPDGKFEGWVMRTVTVDQASDGSAEVLLEMPCNIYVGSNACDANPKNYYGTAPEGSRMYTELAKMTVGDFALTSGQFVYTDDKAFDKNRSVASFRYMRTAAHCKAKEVAADTEFFGIKLDVISTIK